MDVVLWFMVMFMVVSMVTLENVKANIGEFDDHWKQKEEQAKMNAAQAYNPNPHAVANDFHKAVTRKLWSFKKFSRRHLGDGGCVAANPIDQCWRCDANWAENRQKLAECVIGFGHKTTGGKGGKIYEVTDPTDSDVVEPKPGTLRHAVIQEGPLWIIFAKPMTITLTQELLVSSNKTIDGRGAEVTITGGGGFMMQFVSNIIIHGLTMTGMKAASGGVVRDSPTHTGHRTPSDGDAVSIFGGTNIWVDHLTLSNCKDGLVDAIEGSTAITVSNCMFTDHNDVMLLGAQDGNQKDEVMQITVAFNHFGEKCIQRMPRVRMGFAHVVNNDYTHWEMYAIGGSSHPTIVSHGNRFNAANNRATKEVTKREYAPPSEWKTWIWTSTDDIFENGAFFTESGDKSKVPPADNDAIKGSAGGQVAELTKNAGALTCVVGQPC